MKKKIENITFRVKESCEKTGISISHMNYLIKTNKIKSYLPSPKVRLIDAESLMNYIKNNGEVQNG